jgi:hypothetical protein
MRLVEHRREPTDEAQGHGGKAGRAGQADEHLDGNIKTWIGGLR